MPKGIFHPLDFAIFKQIDKFKTSSAYQQVADLTNGLSDFQQKVINQISTAIVITIPFLIALGFFYSNYQLRQEIHERKEILRLVDQYNQKQKQVNDLGRSVLAQTSISNKPALEGKIRSILPGQGKKIRVQKFEQTSPASSISLVNASLTFSKLSLKNLTGLLQGIVYKERAKVASLKVNRNSKTGFLEGSLDIVHYGKAKTAAPPNDKKPKK